VHKASERAKGGRDASLREVERGRGRGMGIQPTKGALCPCS